MAARAGLPLAPARSSWLSAWPFGTRCGTEPFPTLSTSHEGPVSLATSADQARASLGIRLRDIRRDTELSGTQLARLADWLPSKVSKIEHGKQTPTDEDLRVWCEHCRAPGQLADLIAAVRSIETQFAEWRRIIRGGTRRRQEASAAACERARPFRVDEPAGLPGALETHSYADPECCRFIDFDLVPQE